MSGGRKLSDPTSGLASGLAAVLWASRFESAQTNTALGFELQTVAASVEEQRRENRRPLGM